MAKTVSVYFDDAEEQTYSDAMARRVNLQWGKKISPYIVDLVKKDLAGEGPLLEAKDNVVLQMAKLFHPTLLPELSQALGVAGAAKQSKIVARFIESLAEALKREDFHPDERFHLFNSVDQLTAVTKTEPGKVLIKSLAEYLQRPEIAALAADPPTTYGDVSDAAAEAERRKAAARKSDHKPTTRRQSGPSEPKAKE